MRITLLLFLLIGGVVSATADITIYTVGSPELAAAAVAALNARPDREKYVLAEVPLPGKFPIRRFVKPFNVSKVSKDAPVLRTKIALVVNRSGNPVDAVGFDSNYAAFSAAIAQRLPKMIGFIESKIF